MHLSKVIFCSHLLLASLSYSQGFTGAFDLTNWLAADVSGGSADLSNQPFSVSLTGENSGVAGVYDFYLVYNGNCPSPVKFNWSVANHPDCGYDSLLYGVNNNFVFLTDCNASGVVGPLVLQPGDQFTLRISTPDGNFGAPTAVISNFDHNAIVPDLATLPPVTLTCVTGPLTPPTAVDGCGNPLIGIPDFSFPFTGIAQVPWYYADSDGNLLVQNQTLDLEDIYPPIPAADSLYPFTAFCSATPVIPSAIDTCGGNVTITCSHSFPITTIGTTIITWSYADYVGNISTQQQEIQVEPVTSNVFVNGQTLYTDYSSPSAQFQWFDCGTGLPISGADSASIIAADDQTMYRLVVTDNSCSDTSDCVSIATAGLFPQTISSLKVFPNPVDDLLEIRSDIIFSSNFTIVDAQGRTVFKGLLENGAATINTSRIQPGTYLLKLEKSLQVVKIVKR